MVCLKWMENFAVATGDVLLCSCQPGELKVQ